MIVSLVAVAVVLCQVISPAVREAYFCTEEKTVLEYERRYVDSGRLKWHHELSILKSSASPDGTLMLGCSSLFMDSRGKVLNGGEVHFCTEILPDGAVCADPSEALKSVLCNRLPDKVVSSVPARSVLPSELMPDTVLPELEFSVSAVGLVWRVRVSERRVLREERLSTDAGAFDCIVVSEHKVEKGPGRNRETTALTWYARGIGMVRHDTYDKSGRLETSEVLRRIRQ